MIKEEVQTLVIMLYMSGHYKEEYRDDGMVRVTNGDIEIDCTIEMHEHFKAIARQKLERN